MSTKERNTGSSEWGANSLKCNTFKEEILSHICSTQSTKISHHHEFKIITPFHHFKAAHLGNVQKVKEKRALESQYK